MRLLKIAPDGTISLTKFWPHDVPAYAILSHTWETDDQELTFQDMVSGNGRSKKGYTKVQFCGDQALKDGLMYFWVDSCCIDKSNITEISEAINSMYRWYRDAVKCYVYLSDVHAVDPDRVVFPTCRWVTRGWTLQELLAPEDVEFFTQSREKFGTKKSMKRQLHEATGIPIQVLENATHKDLARYSVEEQLSWAANRQTTLDEDNAYCLFGIFEIYLPLIYGEGKEHAFRRLRKEILSKTTQSEDSAVAEDPAIDENDACLTHLAAKDQSALIAQILRRNKGACQWMVSNPQYIAWVANPRSAVLWVVAHAGCGKTTIAANVSRLIAPSGSNQPTTPSSDTKAPIVLVFLFQRSNQEGRNNAQAAMRAFISQLVQQRPQLLQVLVEKHRSLSTNDSFEWTWDNLEDTFVELLGTLAADSLVYIIVDAMDECETTTQSTLMEWIRQMVDGNPHSSSFPELALRLKVLVTSRYHGNVIDHLSDFPTFAIKDTDTVDDMHTLISSRVGELARRRSLNKEITQTITDFMKENARGMFIWVVLAIKELERRDQRLSDEVIRSKLSKTPLTLSDTYQSILKATLPPRDQDMWRIIRWILFGSRNLTFEELRRALCLEVGISNWHDLDGDLKTLCGSLIRFGGPQEDITLVHLTARGFLENHIKHASISDTAGIGMDPDRANEHLAVICLRYMLNEDIFVKLQKLLKGVKLRSVYGKRMRAFLYQHPFLSYAIDSWAYHLRIARSNHDDPDSASALAVELLSTSTARDGLIRLTYYLNKHRGWNVPIGPSPLHLASYFNLPQLARTLISGDKSLVRTTTKRNGTPLNWAAEMGSTECVQVLLSEGTDPNEFEANNWSALHWAAKNGHLDVAKLLLEHNARLLHHDFAGSTPLDWALYHEHRELVKLFREWIAINDPENADKYCQQDERVSKKRSVDLKVSGSGPAWAIEPYWNHQSLHS